MGTITPGQSGPESNGYEWVPLTTGNSLVFYSGHLYMCVRVCVYRWWWGFFLCKGYSRHILNCASSTDLC